MSSRTPVAYSRARERKIGGDTYNGEIERREGKMKDEDRKRNRKKDILEERKEKIFPLCKIKFSQCVTDITECVLFEEDF